MSKLLSILICSLSGRAESLSKLVGCFDHQLNTDLVEICMPHA